MNFLFYQSQCASLNDQNHLESLTSLLGWIRVFDLGKDFTFLNQFPGAATQWSRDHILGTTVLTNLLTTWAQFRDKVPGVSRISRSWGMELGSDRSAALPGSCSLLRTSKWGCFTPLSNKCVSAELERSSLLWWKGLLTRGGSRITVNHPQPLATTILLPNLYAFHYS